MTSLTERIEAATGPSKEINRIIAKHMGWHRVEPRFLNNSRGGWISPDDFIGTRSNGTPIFDSLHGTDIHGDVPNFTASLDAAMTLVPDGCDWVIGHTNGGLTIYAEVGGTGGEYTRFASTPALALCAAALRARGVE